MQISRFFLVSCFPALLVACAIDEGGLEEEAELGLELEENLALEQDLEPDLDTVIVTPDMDAETVAALYPGCRLDVNASQGAGKAYGRTSVYCDRIHYIYVATNLYRNGGLVCSDTSVCDSTSCGAQCSVTNPAGTQRWCALGWGDVEGVDVGERTVCRSF